MKLKSTHQAIKIRRKVVHELYVIGFTFRQIAVILGVAASTVVNDFHSLPVEKILRASDDRPRKGQFRHVVANVMLRYGELLCKRVINERLQPHEKVLAEILRVEVAFLGQKYLPSSAQLL